MELKNFVLKDNCLKGIKYDGNNLSEIIEFFGPNNVEVIRDKPHVKGYREDDRMGRPILGSMPLTIILKPGDICYENREGYACVLGDEAGFYTEVELSV